MPTLAELLALPSASGLRGDVASDTDQLVIIPPGASGAEAFAAATPTMSQDEVDAAAVVAFDRTNHTGTQPIASVSGLAAALGARTHLAFNLINDGGWAAAVGSIGTYAYQNATLTELYIGSATTSIGSHAFYGCSNLTSVNIPDSVTSIDNWVFASCTSLASITIPDSVTSIGDSAFRDCTSLTSVTIPDSVTSIGSYAFSYCTSLTSVTIPDSVTSIGSGAFRDCTSLTTVIIGDSVTSIGGGAFSSCTSLTSVTIGENITNIGNTAFAFCTALATVNIYAIAAPILDGDVFMNCPAPIDIHVPVGATGYSGGEWDNHTIIDDL